jgi:hypothetical protein
MKKVISDDGLTYETELPDDIIDGHGKTLNELLKELDKLFEEAYNGEQEET